MPAKDMNTGKLRNGAVPACVMNGAIHESAGSGNPRKPAHTRKRLNTIKHSSFGGDVVQDNVSYVTTSTPVTPRMARKAPIKGGDMAKPPGRLISMS